MTSPQLFTIADADDPSKLIRINFYIANDLPTFLREWLAAVIEVPLPSRGMGSVTLNWSTFRLATVAYPIKIQTHFLCGVTS